jgi:hypothetical protein
MTVMDSSRSVQHRIASVKAIAKHEQGAARCATCCALSFPWDSPTLYVGYRSSRTIHHMKFFQSYNILRVVQMPHSICCRHMWNPISLGSKDTPTKCSHLQVIARFYNGQQRSTELARCVPLPPTSFDSSTMPDQLSDCPSTLFDEARPHC